MANAIQRKEISGEGIHVRDCYVWTEIHYLDSGSDYREYLEQDRHLNRDGRLTMFLPPRLSLLAIVFFLIAVLIACLSVLR